MDKFCNNRNGIVPLVKVPEFDINTLHVKNLPKCQFCSNKMSRPNVSMFGDFLNFMENHMSIKKD